MIMFIFFKEKELLSLLYKYCMKLMGWILCTELDLMHWSKRFLFTLPFLQQPPVISFPPLIGAGEPTWKISPIAQVRREKWQNRIPCLFVGNVSANAKCCCCEMQRGSLTPVAFPYCNDPCSDPCYVMPSQLAFCFGADR